MENTVVQGGNPCVQSSSILPCPLFSACNIVPCMLDPLSPRSCCCASLPSVPQCPLRLGARWVRGGAGHPPESLKGSVLVYLHLAMVHLCSDPTFAHFGLPHNCLLFSAWGKGWDLLSLIVSTRSVGFSSPVTSTAPCLNAATLPSRPFPMMALVAGGWFEAHGWGSGEE